MPFAVRFFTNLVLSGVAAGAMACAGPARAAAAGAPGDVPPRISVSGAAEVTAPPARGAFSIGIETTRPTAAAASGEAARLTQAVTAALKQAGLAAADLKGTRLTVSEQWSYDDKTRQRRRDGFRASNTLLVDTAQLEQLGGFLDAALSAGATSVSDIQYAPADAPALRREALGRAVREARSDAAAIAGAAGGALGELLEISTERAGVMPLPRAMSVTTAMRAGDAVPTTVMPGDIHVAASVTAAWRFVTTTR